MVKIAILIGFSYGEDDEYTLSSRYPADPERNPLPGIVVDLYQAYVASSNMQPDKIVVITDISKDQQTSVLMNAMIDGTVDSGILNFIDVIKRKKSYYRFSGNDDFLDCLRSNLLGATESFIYYTGHVNKGYIIFPIMSFLDDDISFVGVGSRINDISQLTKSKLEKKNKMLLIEFRDLILSSVHSHAQIFLVMDCCNGNGLCFPFQLQKSVYRLTHEEPRFYTSQEVICLSSTMSDENSITSRDGSIFTRSLFRQLKENQTSVVRLMEAVGKECLKKYAQTATVHASFPNLFMIWNWIYMVPTIDIKYDPISDILILDLESERKVDKNIHEICAIDLNS